MWDLLYNMNNALACLCAALLWLAFRRFKNHASRPLPPGPPSLPIIGNLLHMPRSHLWERAAAWGEQYGDLVYVENFGVPMLFINSFETASTLLSKRSAIYSSRPRLVMADDLQGWGWSLTQLPYGETMRKHRAYLHRFFQTSDALNYTEMQERETFVMLNGILNTPEDYTKHVGRLPGAVILRNVYGYEVQDENDPMVHLGQTVFRNGAEALGYIFLDFVPWLKNLPEWFPGVKFPKFGKEGRQMQEMFRATPFAMAKKRFIDGSAKECMTSILLSENMHENGTFHDEQNISDAASVAFLGSSDTSVTTIMVFILAMLKYPEKQKRAQDEIDSVIGPERLPRLADKELLPYVRAICTETHRFEVILPLGLPHALSEEDEYMGYRIPAGTTVFPNVWAMSRDPVRYPDPQSFKPERWIQGDGDIPTVRPQDYTFGFGRRVCPGQVWAEDIVFLAVASILATFDIEKGTAPDGSPIAPNEELTTGPVRTLGRSECKITPRSDRTASLIRQSFASL